MEKYKDTRLSDSFVNLTNDSIYTYEKSTGSIICIPPQKREIPAFPSYSYAHDEPIVHYILDPKFIEALIAFGRPLDDVATIRFEQRGRDHIKIAYFAWAKDESIDVCLYKNAHSASFTHK